MITSANNTQVKNIIQLNQKAKARREQGLFVAEGRKMFGEAPKDWISRVYVTESLTADESLMKQVMELPEEKREIVADNVFRQMCDTRTPQGILTVLKKPVWTVEDILKGEAPLVMVLEDLQDPGNAGTIFRTGEGAGVSGFSYENLRRHYQSKGHPINYGICLQNAFPICGGCGIIKSRTGAKRYPYLCSPPERKKFL